ncbi:MAG: flagellar basal-body rod protein FlgF [Robiginitomaculum sp.]|nr:MAG: flagellar basal-body rod protein FlgF [Robiginitomaculum sp.]
MDNSSYINIARQSGLLKELSMIANNIANISTTGYRREGAVFTEFVNAHGNLAGAGNKDYAESSTSIGRLGAHFSDFSVGDMKRTGGTFDLAIDGVGFFSVDTQAGPRLTRAGNFMTNSENALVTPMGYPVLDAAGSAIQIPQGAMSIAIAGDGTISADGSPVGRVGVFTAEDVNLKRMGDNLWEAVGGAEPLADARILQGFLEGSNVNPVNEIARMIEVQRSYEAGQKLLDLENERASKTISAIRQAIK